MDVPSAADGPPAAVLSRFRDSLGRTYGERLDRVVLFGSRARGDHRPDSDFDVAVFIRDPETLWTELGRLADLTTHFLLDDIWISAKPFSAERYWEDSSLMRNIRQDGVEL